MSITFIKHQCNIKTNNQVLLEKNNNIITQTKLYNMFFVIGRTFCGGRFYSETTENYEQAYQLFSSYKDIIKYFGGGEVELVCVSKEGYDIIDICKIN